MIKNSEKNLLALYPMIAPKMSPGKHNKAT